MSEHFPEPPLEPIFDKDLDVRKSLAMQLQVELLQRIVPVIEELSQTMYAKVPRDELRIIAQDPTRLRTYAYVVSEEELPVEMVYVPDFLDLLSKYILAYYDPGEFQLH